MMLLAAIWIFAAGLDVAAAWANFQDGNALAGWIFAFTAPIALLNAWLASES